LISSKRRHKTAELTCEDSENDNADINNNKNERRIKLDYMKHFGISRLAMESKRACTYPSSAQFPADTLGTSSPGTLGTLKTQVTNF